MFQYSRSLIMFGAHCLDLCPCTLRTPLQAFGGSQRASLNAVGATHAVEATVLLSEQPIKVTSWVEVPGVQPLATPDDCFEAEAIVKADTEVQVG